MLFILKILYERIAQSHRILCFAGNMWHITLDAPDHRISINEMLFIRSKLHYLYIHVTYVQLIILFGILIRTSLTI